MVATPERQTFRLRPALRFALGSAIYLWSVVLLILLWRDDPFPTGTWLSVIFFIALFTAVRLFYGGLTITADNYAVTYRGLLSFRSFPYERMLRMDVRPGLPGLLTYDVFTRDGLLQFTNFLERHEQLMEIIADRANLDRTGRVNRL